jgi:hypothetical protein
MLVSATGFVAEDRSGMAVFATPREETNGNTLPSRRDGDALNASDVMQMERIRALSRWEDMTIVLCCNDIMFGFGVLGALQVVSERERIFDFCTLVLPEPSVVKIVLSKMNNNSEYQTK